MRLRAAGLGLGSLAVAVALLTRPSSEAAAGKQTLPLLGTQLGQFPPGPMKALADQACLNCHSAEMTLQQRLTDKQWTAEIDKMVGWGAVVPEDQKAALVAYLTEHFGPNGARR